MLRCAVKSRFVWGDYGLSLGLVYGHFFGLEGLFSVYGLSLRIWGLFSILVNFCALGSRLSNAIAIA